MGIGPQLVVAAGYLPSENVQDIFTARPLTAHPAARMIEGDEYQTRLLQKENQMRTLLLLPMMIGALYADVTRTCSNVTIQGTYSYTITGSSVAGGPGPIELAMGVGVRHYDGDGNFTQVDVVKRSVSGPLIDLPNSGTYKVNPDCTGTAYLGGPPGSPATNETRFVIMNHGKEIRWIVLTPAFLMVSGHAVRQ